MSEVHGSKLSMTFNAIAITTAYMRDDVEFGAGEIDLLDRTNYGATADRHGTSPIKKGTPITIGGILSDESHAAIQPLEGTDAALIIGPVGTATGKPKLSGQATLTNYKVKSSVYVDATWSATLTPNAGLAWTSF